MWYVCIILFKMKKIYYILYIVSILFKKENKIMLTIFFIYIISAFKWLYSVKIQNGYTKPFLLWPPKITIDFNLENKNM